MKITATLPDLLEPVNQLLTPAIRLGAANPLPLTSGFVLLEIVGRKSREVRPIPLLCADYGSALVVSTVRSNSQWVKNLAAAGNASVWLRGRRRDVTAQVYQDGERLTEAGSNNLWTATARSFSRLSGASVAVLSLN